MRLHKIERLEQMKRKTVLAALAILNLALLAAEAQVTVTTVTTNGLTEPYNVVLDADSNVYVTDSVNNRIVKIEASTQVHSTLAGIAEDPPGSNNGPAYLAHFNNPEGLLAVTIGTDDGVLVADNGNHLIRFVRFSDGYVTTVAGQLGGGPAINGTGANATFLYPLGMAQDGSGHVYIADWGNNVIRVLDLNDPAFSVTTLTTSGTTFYRPAAVVLGNTNQLWVTDTGNQQIKLLTLSSPSSSSLTSSLGAYRTSGTTDSSYGPNARFNSPSGLLWVNGVGLLISDTLNNSIRLATNYASFGATNYAVSTFAGTPGSAGLVDGNVSSAKFNSPFGLASDPLNNGFLVADLKNNALRRVQIGPPLPPVPTPQLGWVLFVKDNFGDYVSSLQVGQSFVFNNDVLIEILGTDGTETHFTFGPTPANPLNDTIPNPSSKIGSTPGVYRNGVHAADVPPSIISAQPDVTVKAIGFETGRQSSSIASARFQFKTAAPLIQGNNAASFTITDQTIGSAMWYTIDGSDPTNAPPSTGPIGAGGGTVTLSINAPTNFTFKIRAFRDNYQPSEIASQEFSATNFNANKISFGFASGEASSDFVGSPGQFFYAPVTLTVLQNAQMYSLQFNVTVTNNVGTTHVVEPGALSFTSTLMEAVPPGQGDHLPPATIQWYNTIPPAAVVGFTTNSLGITNVPVFGSLLVTNAAQNLLGVGWLERWGQANLFNTILQDLISFSIAHDTLFTKSSGRVVLGSYGFKVPLDATPGEQYRIQLGRPTATSDGVGAPGSDVFIDTPTNGTVASGAINAFKNVTVGQRKYIVGDVYPFRWFNAGDFGNTNLENADVMQVFQSAVYGMDNPPPGSDFFDGMDSCGYIGMTNQGSGYLTNLNAIGSQAALFDGNDTTINCIAFGDGVLDVCDIYVTFRRSLDPSLLWFQRFWTNGTLAAEIVGNPPTNPPNPSAIAGCPSFQAPPAAAKVLSVSFAASDLQGSAGQTLQVPVRAQVFGSYPLRVMALKLSVNPLDGSPALTGSITFTPSPDLGQPAVSAPATTVNYAAAWLNSSIAGLTNNALLGTLNVPIPSNASSNSAYAIHFDHASASPNGLASFPKQTRTGLITLADRSISSFNDGIPDSWRLRYFGTVNNLLSQASADADGDGANNWQEYVAGTDPTDAKSNLKVSTQKGQAGVIRWPSVAGKTYIIERSSSLFAPSWTPVSTNAGTGADMEFHDITGGRVHFYRVHVQ